MTHNNNGQEWWLQEDSDMLAIESPEGMWQYHSDSQTITEEQAAEIVEKIGASEGGYNLYRDYEYPEDQFMTAKYSYHSLLRSLGLDGKRIINLKKI